MGLTTKIRLTWDPDTSRNIEWYKIYRSTSEYETTATLLDSVRSNITTYTDTTAPNGYYVYYWASAVDSSGVESRLSHSAFASSFPFLRIKLFPNYPNPFNPSTLIDYTIPKDTHVTLKTYDVLGREVETLVNENEQVGRYRVNFDGARLASGAYFYRLVAGSHVITKKMILLK